MPWLLLQAMTVAVFASTVSDPRAAMPISAVLYPDQARVCGLARFVEVVPIVNPTHAYYPDPADASKDCRVDVRAQIVALGTGQTYRAAARSDQGVYGPLSTPFQTKAPPLVDVCVSAPLTLAVSRWPAGTTGSRSFTYRTNRAAQVTVDLLTTPWTATALDARGCRVTVRR